MLYETDDGCGIKRERILGDNSPDTTPLPKIAPEVSPLAPTRGHDPITDPLRGVLTLTLTLTTTDPWAGNYLKTGTDPHS